MTILSGLRFDYVDYKRGSSKRTDEGYLQAVAPVARVGVMSYRLADGTIRKEFVPPETLFNKDSMETLKMKPVTNSHPPEILLDRSSAKGRKVGYTGEQINQDDTFLMVNMTVTDDDALQDVEKGRRQLSPGYRCDLRMEAGSFNGQDYDAVQVNRRYNHVALVDAARGGSSLMLHVDHLDGLEVKEDFNPNHDKTGKFASGGGGAGGGGGSGGEGDLPTSGEGLVTTSNGVTYERGKNGGLTEAGSKAFMSDIKINEKATRERLRRGKETNKLVGAPAGRVMGIPIEQQIAARKIKAGMLARRGLSPAEIENQLDSMDTIDEAFLNTPSQKERSMAMWKIDGIDYEVAPEVARQLEKQDAALKAGTTELETVKADRDTLKAKVETLEKIDVAAEAKKLAAARTALERAVTPHLDEETVKKIDSLSDADLRKAVILKAFPKADEQLKGASDIYIQARFDSALDVLAGASQNDGDASQRKTVNDKTSSASRKDEADAEKARNDYAERTKNLWKDEKK